MHRVVTGCNHIESCCLLSTAREGSVLLQLGLCAQQAHAGRRFKGRKMSKIPPSKSWPLFLTTQSEL
ncbi:hypothetical protein GDO81_018325 [Engystomops pustulosus]|uniref:Uncharacterized protein n=1 Tax=Engystomops pustulosus TaxID=76066 RepID=A0AAV7A6J9_ENGPU|nr:hypothetical protein GDO81_018325 [Engystomops pustulosus]